jgi:hypothetical protein
MQWSMKRGVHAAGAPSCDKSKKVNFEDSKEEHGKPVGIPSHIAGRFGFPTTDTLLIDTGQ